MATDDRNQRDYGMTSVRRWQWMPGGMDVVLETQMLDDGRNRQGSVGRCVCGMAFGQTTCEINRRGLERWQREFGLNVSRGVVLCITELAKEHLCEFSAFALQHQLAVEIHRDQEMDGLNSALNVRLFLSVDDGTGRNRTSDFRMFSFRCGN